MSTRTNLKKLAEQLMVNHSNAILEIKHLKSNLAKAHKKIHNLEIHIKYLEKPKRRVVTPSRYRN